MLRGGGLGRADPPQGHSPNDMVICVRNLPYLKICRGDLESLGVLWGSRGVRGRPGKSWGSPREVPGGSRRVREGPGRGLEKVIFFFFRSEFVNGLS